MDTQPNLDSVSPFGERHNQNEGTTRETCVSINRPRRILHFSDGTMEENSDEDETDGHKKNNETAIVDPSTLTWLPWFAYQAVYMGTKSLEVCDYLGEKLAAFFGITTPKYQYVIDEYNRMIEQEKQAKKEMDVELGGWMNKNQVDAINSQPKAEQMPTISSTIPQ